MHIAGSQSRPCELARLQIVGPVAKTVRRWPRHGRGSLLPRPREDSIPIAPPTVPVSAHLATHNPPLESTNHLPSNALPPSGADRPSTNTIGPSYRASVDISAHGAVSEAEPRTCHGALIYSRLTTDTHHGRQHDHLQASQAAHRRPRRGAHGPPPRAQREPPANSADSRSRTRPRAPSSRVSRTPRRRCSRPRPPSSPPPARPRTAWSSSPRRTSTRS